MESTVGRLKRRHRYNGSVHTSPLRKHVPLRGKFRGEQERYRCSLRNESRTSNLPHQRRFSISLRTKSFLEVAQILKFQRSLAWNWSIEGQEDGGEGIIVGNWVSHTTVSRKSHFQPSLAVKGSRADYRVAARNIGGSCEKRRIQLASAPLWFSCKGWGVVLFPSWNVLDYRRSGKWFISVPETAESWPRNEKRREKL